jgi:putative ABC transport system permease protein
MLPLRLCVDLAMRALRRNRLQTALAVLGMTVGVGAVVTSMALGQGAQAAINEQLRAAGANIIVVTAGNYKVKGEEIGGGVVAHQASARSDDAYGHVTLRFADWRSAADADAEADADAKTEANANAIVDAEAGARAGAGVRQPRLLLVRHPEDDPLAVHNHPTAKQRLGDAMAGLGAAATLTRDDAEAIRREIGGVQYVAAGVHESARVVNGARIWFTRLHGSDTELPLIRRGWSFPHGAYFGDRDVRSAAQVMVLGRVASDRLFGDGVNPVGREVRLWNQAFQVVGVLTSKSWAVQPTPGDDQFDAVYVPFTTVHKLLNLSKLNTITVTAASVGDTTRISRDVVKLLRQRHGIGESAPDDFTVSTQAQQALGKGLPPSLARVVTGNMTDVEQVTVDQLSRSLNRANWTMVGLLAGVATVSLLVGGIGIMNLLLLSVTERTREIGLRIALGARRQDVVMQFVSEAVLLSLTGGLLGIVVGAVASGGLAQIFRWAAVISPGTVVLSVVVAALVGVAFGVYPARRAAQLDPIEALRHE